MKLFGRKFKPSLQPIQEVALERTSCFTSAGALDDSLRLRMRAGEPDSSPGDEDNTIELPYQDSVQAFLKRNAQERAKEIRNRDSAAASQECKVRTRRTHHGIQSRGSVPAFLELNVGKGTNVGIQNRRIAQASLMDRLAPKRTNENPNSVQAFLKCNARERANNEISNQKSVQAFLMARQSAQVTQSRFYSQ